MSDTKMDEFQEDLVAKKGCGGRLFGFFYSEFSL